jgi:chromosomal replication initiation ATPase DnaA
MTSVTRTIAELKGRLRTGTQVTVQVAVPIVAEAYGVSVADLEALRRVRTMPVAELIREHERAIEILRRQLPD